MKRIIMLFCAAMSMLMPVFAENTASAEFSIIMPEYVKIEPVMSPVLVANITDRSGNLHIPLCTKFRVITNTSEEKTLYLKAHTITDAGQENAMFAQGGMVYVAFGNLAKVPKSQSLANCKIGSLPKESPGVVAYPITSVNGLQHKFMGDKYEVYVKNGTSYLTVNIGSHVLRSSYAGNDPLGVYQSILSLTEADI